MKLTARTTGYSSVVGGGLMLCDDNGRARFLVNFIGTFEGITKEESQAMSQRIGELINEHGLSVSDRASGEK